eukprot:CAMPEP_0194292958 /NCGR_PEP_ID=MMETSP0169-20130528/46814_1 /TAXON_ID=218684 /ORGANISM="Corethron pennatum, Strain L29A3" /LENGTH=259 /DNA_ID=CAMNT_0039041303 /DNA_START=169 /DNA_END=945 /DNA_ORIENTATION=+
MPVRTAPPIERPPGAGRRLRELVERRARRAEVAARSASLRDSDGGGWDGGAGGHVPVDPEDLDEMLFSSSGSEWENDVGRRRREGDRPAAKRMRRADDVASVASVADVANVADVADVADITDVAIVADFANDTIDLTAEEGMTSSPSESETDAIIGASAKADPAEGSDTVSAAEEGTMDVLANGELTEETDTASVADQEEISAVAAEGDGGTETNCPAVEGNGSRDPSVSARRPLSAGPAAALFGLRPHELRALTTTAY